MSSMSVTNKKRSFINRTIYEKPLLSFARYLTRHTPKVIMYHRFGDVEINGKTSLEMLDTQLRQLRSNFNLFSLSKMVELKNNEELPAHSVAVTIDDGYRDFFDYAYPLFRKYSIPATLFITSGFINGELSLWPDRIKYLVAKVKPETLQNTPVEIIGNLKIDPKMDRNSISKVIFDHCISIKDHEREIFISKLENSLNISLVAETVDDYLPMNWQMIREITKANIEVGAHTRSHPILSNIEDKNILIEEIKGSKRDVENNIDKPVFCFGYPNGQKTDYNKDIKVIVRESGFKCAVVAFYDKNAWPDNYEIRRYGVCDNIRQFTQAINGYEYLSTYM